MKPWALILHATGTNRDHDAAQAFELAGAQPQIVHINQLRKGEKQWSDFQILVIAGGFSYADALGAGKLLALDLNNYFSDKVQEFISKGKPVIGICNGFQALIKAGILPYPASPDLTDQIKQEHSPITTATLTFNALGHFECRWVRLLPQSQKCIWTRDLIETIECPVAHGEGNFLTEPGMVTRLEIDDQVALRYVFQNGQQAGGSYPENPNGSMHDIAGICNPQGNVLGLMPHPENHIFHWQHPQWTRGISTGSGLPLFINGVRHACQI